MIWASLDKSKIPWTRRNGIYGHLPKWYMCRGLADDFSGEYEPCPKPTRHLNYPGYIRLLTTKWIITWYYWGRYTKRMTWDRRPK